MRDIEQYLDKVVDSGARSEGQAGQGQVVMQHVPQVVQDSEEGTGKSNPLKGILRRWHLVLLIFVIVVGIGVPLVWFLVEPGYVVQGYLRIASSQVNIVTGETNPINYHGNLRTQAMAILTSSVIENVADDLKDQDLKFFRQYHDDVSRLTKKIGFRLADTGPRDPVVVLKEAIASDIITSAPIRDTEVVAVTMKSMARNEAIKIVNSFLRNYEAQYRRGGQEATQQTLRLLKDQREQLKKSMDLTRQSIRNLASEYGAAAPTIEEEMQVRRVATLYERLNAVEARRINAEIQVGLLTQHPAANSAVPVDASARSEHINKDPGVAELNRSILSIEQDLVVAQQTLAPENPSIKEKQELLEAFKEQLLQKREELGKEFDRMHHDLQAESREAKLAAAQMELDLLKTEEDRLKTMLSDQDLKKREISAVSLRMQDEQLQLDLDKDMYDSLGRRIREVEMEIQRNPSIEILSEAEEKDYEDKRLKMTAAMFFAGLGLGCLLAFFLDKRDKRIWAPDEIQHHVELPLLGTVTRFNNTRKIPHMADSLVSDFQTIRTNLGLINTGGVPKTFAVVSAATKDGKTTFCVNLATSLVGTGKRVLLVDGDLRRPSIMRTLGTGHNTNRSHRVVNEGGFNYTIHTIPTTGLDVLEPEVLCLTDPFELISSPAMADCIYKMSERYDHIVIDTPPVLAFPDAMLLAKIAGSVVLVSFAGKTLGPEMTEVVARIELAGVRVVGAIMNNVVTDNAYHKYGYNYSYGTMEKDGFTEGERPKGPQILLEQGVD